MKIGKQPAAEFAVI